MMTTMIAIKIIVSIWIHSMVFSSFISMNRLLMRMCALCSVYFVLRGNDGWQQKKLHKLVKQTQTQVIKLTTLNKILWIAPEKHPKFKLWYNTMNVDIRVKTIDLVINRRKFIICWIKDDAAIIRNRYRIAYQIDIAWCITVKCAFLFVTDSEHFRLKSEISQFFIWRSKKEQTRI